MGLVPKFYDQNQWPTSILMSISLFLTGDEVTELFKFDYLVLITYNPGHDILELCNILVQIQFTTSKMKLDICYNKLCMRVASRVVEQLKT